MEEWEALGYGKHIQLEGCLEVGFVLLEKNFYNILVIIIILVAKFMEDIRISTVRHKKDVILRLLCWLVCCCSHFKGLFSIKIVLLIMYNNEKPTFSSWSII